VTVDLDALLSQGPHGRGKRPRTLPTDVQQARSTEVRRRLNLALDMAQTALRRAHYDDYRSLVNQAHAKVAAESGPLPGDE
jgi:hypothetical protein